MTIELSDKAKENLRRNEEARKKESRYLRLEPSEKTVRRFDPEKMEPVEVEFDGKKSIRYQYIVTDPSEPQQPEKYFTVSKRNSAQVDILLAEGQNILKIHRIGAGKETQYMFTPA
jgi:hypothetical protein